MFIPRDPDKIPEVWAVPSGVVVPQSSVPDGPHDWHHDGILRACRKCGVVVFTGSSDPDRALRRLAGVSCPDAVAIDVMKS